MAIVRYLAMTAGEMRDNSAFPPRIAWMACHFSPYTRGLSNLPRNLSADSLLIVNDYTPLQGHDPEVIARQLAQMDCSGILLDFQRPGCEDAAGLVKHLVEALPCPVIVSDLYGKGLTCPVFLPPMPPSVALAEYLAPWQGREIWLEMALDGEVITVKSEGTKAAPLPCGEKFADGFAEEKLHCHYRIEMDADAARFTLWRTMEDLEGLLEEAEGLGVTSAVGLYQELQDFPAQEAFPRDANQG